MGAPVPIVPARRFARRAAIVIGLVSAIFLALCATSVGFARPGQAGSTVGSPGRTRHRVKAPSQKPEAADSKEVQDVPRLDGRDLSAKEVEELISRGPVLLRHTPEDLDTGRWCRTLRREVGPMTVLCKQQQLSPTDQQVWKVRLRDFLDDEMPGSTHQKPRYLFEEDLLYTEDCWRTGLAQAVRLPERLFGRNYFEEFPVELQPSACCLVAAGQGARSTLHRDPFEWTGTSLCLQGTKLWTFVPPGLGGVQEVDSAFKAYRFPYEGYEMNGQSIAAGWQSDMDLYEKRLPGPSQAPEAVAADLSDWWSGRTSYSRLLPPAPLREEFPEDAVPRCFVQREGELLLIPAHWWHQAYTLEPSIAVSSQYMNDANSERVLSHIARWCGCSVEVMRTGLLSQDDSDDEYAEDSDDEFDEERFLAAAAQDIRGLKACFTMEDEGQEALYFSRDDLE